MREREREREREKPEFGRKQKPPSKRGHRRGFRVSGSGRRQ